MPLATSHPGLGAGRTWKAAVGFVAFPVVTKSFPTLCVNTPRAQLRPGITTENVGEMRHVLSC